jgi:hypothetical protein
MNKRSVDLTNRELGSFKVLRPAGQDEKKRHVWACEHRKEEGGCGAITLISSAVLLTRAPKFCTECRPKNYRVRSNGIGGY